MFADEVQNGTVEDFRMLPVSRVPAVLKYDSLRAGDRPAIICITGGGKAGSASAALNRMGTRICSASVERNKSFFLV